MGQQTYEPIDSNKVKHDFLGLISFVPNKSDTDKRCQLIRNIKKFTQWEKEIKILMNQDCKELFYLPERYQFYPDGLCGNTGFIEMDFQYYKYVLKSEIVSRYHSRMAFEETQLWYMLYNLLEAAFYVEPMNKKIGDVHPSNILINQKGRIKIAPTSIFPKMRNNYEKIVQHKDSDSFLAPEEIENELIQKGIYPKVNPCKAQVFSIGITILMAGTLCDCYFLYDRKTFKFNSQKKNDLMRDIANSYSHYFFNTLNNLLQQNPKKRRSASDVFRELNHFQDQILSLKKFQSVNYLAGDHCSELQEEPSIADFLLVNGGKGGSVIVSNKKNIALQNISQ